MLEEEADLPLALARLLASRLQMTTTYLADIKQQYSDHEGGLGTVDVVLGSLMRSPGTRSALGSERSPSPSTRCRTTTPGERSRFDAGERRPARVAGFVHVTAEHDGRFVLPDPLAAVDELGVGCELLPDDLPGERPVPPGADRDEDLLGLEIGAVDENTAGAGAVEPEGGELAVGICGR